MKTQILAVFTAIIGSNILMVSAATAATPAVISRFEAATMNSRLTQCWSTYGSEERLQAQYDALDALSSAGFFDAFADTQKYLYDPNEKPGSNNADFSAIYTNETCSGTTTYWKLGLIGGTILDLDVNWSTATTSDFTLAELKKAKKTLSTITGGVLFGSYEDCARQAARFEAVLRALPNTEFVSASCNDKNLSAANFYRYSYNNLPISRASYEAIQALLAKKYEELENGSK